MVAVGVVAAISDQVPIANMKFCVSELNKYHHWMGLLLLCGLLCPLVAPYILADTPSPTGSYTQDIPPRSATTGLPPHLPPLLQHTILNQEPPSQVN